MHPSPLGLLFPKESGGLVPGDDVWYYTTMLDQLAILAFRYTLAIDHLSRLRGIDQESAITEVLQRGGEIMVSVTKGTDRTSTATDSRGEPKRTETMESERKTD